MKRDGEGTRQPNLSLVCAIALTFFVFVRSSPHIRQIFHSNLRSSGMLIEPSSIRIIKKVIESRTSLIYFKSIQFLQVQIVLKVLLESLMLILDSQL